MQVITMDEKRIKELADLLNSNKSVEFEYKDLYYQVFESSEYGYVVNVYTSNEKDEDDDFIESNLIDGGLCTGSAKDAIEFMI